MLTSILLVTLASKASQGRVKDEAGSLTTSTFDAAYQTITAVSPSGTTTFTFDQAGNQQLESAPAGITTNVWDYENMRTLVLLPTGARETMTCNADLRMAWLRK